MNISEKEYNEILKKAKLIDPINFMDIAHDFILTGTPMQSSKFDYLPCGDFDHTVNDGTAKTCTQCNEIKPVAMFRLRTLRGKTFTEGSCIECGNKRGYEWRHDPDNNERLKAYFKKYHETHKEDPEYKRKRRDYMKEYHKEYYKRDEVKMRFKTAEYREKRKVIDKRYRDKKKAEKENICNA